MKKKCVWSVHKKEKTEMNNKPPQHYAQNGFVSMIFCLLFALVCSLVALQQRQIQTELLIAEKMKQARILMQEEDSALQGLRCDLANHQEAGNSSFNGIEYHWQKSGQTIEVTIYGTQVQSITYLFDEQNRLLQRQSVR